MISRRYALASNALDRSVRLWNVSTGQCLHTSQGYGNWMGSVAFNPDGSILVSGSGDQKVRL